MKYRFFHYLILLSILGTGLLTFFYTQGNHGLQLVVSFMTAAAYVGWGIVHHSAKGDLHRKVVVEYILVATIAFMLTLLVLGY